MALATISHISFKNDLELIAFEALCIGAVTWIMSSLKLLQWKVFTPTFAAHPPLWVSISFGLIILTQPYSAWIYAAVTSAVIAITFLTLGKHWQNNPEPQKITGLPELRQDIEQWDSHKILSWANEELPLFSKKPHDKSKNTAFFFGYEEYALRIFNRIIAPTDMERDPKSLALVGELGSGKTSIINALVSQLNSDWLVVRVDAWARSADTIDEQILDLVIDKLGGLIDVTAYTKLPSKYHSALQSHGGWWSALSQLSSGEADSTSKLQSIDDLLLTIDKRTLIIIEDPDRGEASETLFRKERVQALMDRLQQHTSNRIKVILAGGMDILRDKDYRVTEYKEIITTPADDFARILQKISDEVWCNPEHNIILPNGKPRFTASDIPNATPRDFKHIIRDIHALWQPGNLLGEIDLKTLITLAFASERVPAFGEYYREFLEEVTPEDYFTHGNTSRCLYRWGKRTSSNNMTLKEQYRLKSIELAKSGEKSKTELSKPELMRSELDIRSSQEINRWIKRLNFIEGFQTIDQDGRVNYLQRFISREAKPQVTSDAKISKLLPGEKLRDQDYFRSMHNLFSQLNTGKTLKRFDIERLIHTGQQSPYLYWRMRGEDIAEFRNEAKLLPLECWVRLATSIIEVMPSIEYTQNHYQHPAGFHLHEIVGTLMSTRAEEQFGENALSAAFDIFMRSVKSPCSAAGNLIWALFKTNDFSKILERQEAV